MWVTTNGQPLVIDVMVALFATEQRWEKPRLHVPDLEDHPLQNALESCLRSSKSLIVQGPDSLGQQETGRPEALLQIKE
jgi:hypothetical protein